MLVNDMKAGPAAVDLVAEMEGFRAQAYLCPAGVWTIGYGHTADVVKNMVISKATARQLLESDLQQAASAVRAAVSVKLSQNQFDALVSFVFNVGAGAFGESTLLGLLNKGDFSGAAEQFRRWNKSGKVVLPGLVRRRAAERELFLRPVKE